LEEKLVNDEIESQTYKKWFKRLKEQTAILETEIQALHNGQSANLNLVERLLPRLTNIPAIFDKANIYQKHTILKEVFKAGLIYKQKKGYFLLSSLMKILIKLPCVARMVIHLNT